MTTEGTGGRGTSGEPDGLPALTDEVWQRFLADSESAIRATAPREPSARERAQGRRPQPPQTVGDLWQPDEPRARVAWRDLDHRGRMRRAARFAVTAAAVALALGAWSQLSTGANPDSRPEEGTVQQVQGAELSTATPLPSGTPVPGAPR
ncbi:hypothetical protein ACFY3O_23815 [Streptomyces sp. NPDC001046]|uniref:hypothetical protein n=1 Tax=unclassified Streptomyces TaxID=2593676 RepID=UPI0036946346